MQNLYAYNLELFMVVKTKVQGQMTGYSNNVNSPAQIACYKQPRPKTF